jgi:hypothetical protein
MGQGLRATDLLVHPRGPILRDTPQALVPVRVGHDVPTLTHTAQTVVGIGDPEASTGAVLLHTVEHRPQIGRGISATTNLGQAVDHQIVHAILGIDTEAKACSLTGELANFEVRQIGALARFSETKQPRGCIDSTLNTSLRILVDPVVSDPDRLIRSTERGDHAVLAHETVETDSHDERRGPIARVHDVDRGEDRPELVGVAIVRRHPHGDAVLLESLVASRALLRLLLACRLDGETVVHHLLDDVGSADMLVSIADVRSRRIGEGRRGHDLEFL